MSSSNTLLQGKKVLIIGGSSGIGRGVAAASLANGASVVIASSTQDKIDAAVELLKKEIEGKQVTVSGEVLDIKDFGALSGFLTKHAPFDHFVLTAGDNLGGAPDPACPAADLRDTLKDGLDVRYWAGLNAANIIHKNNLVRPGGSITFTSGYLAQRPVSGVGYILGAAGALMPATRGLAIDLKPLRVNTIAPGLIDTELIRDMSEQVIDGMFGPRTRNQAIPRMGTPEEVAEAYIFAMKCTYLTGQIITVDGGGVIA